MPSKSKQTKQTKQTKQKIANDANDIICDVSDKYRQEWNDHTIKVLLCNFIDHFDHCCTNQQKLELAAFLERAAKP